MGERLLCKQEVIGSIPFTSTTGFCESKMPSPAAAPLRRERAVGVESGAGEVGRDHRSGMTSLPAGFVPVGGVVLRLIFDR